MDDEKLNISEETKILRVLELYSGIGGLHCALKGSKLTMYKVVGAVDINTSANEVYRHNFPHVPIMQRNIESLTSDDLDVLSPTLIWMSPPCQPFTRIGLKKDCEDVRTNSFLHILEILQRISKKPKYIMVENVKGFEVSEANGLLKQTLTDNNYTFQEFLLSPNQFGIPNSRLRYFLLAKLQPNQFAFQVCPEIMMSVPEKVNDTSQSGTCSNVSECKLLEMPSISHFLEKGQPPSYFMQFLLPDKVLARFANLLDIVRPQEFRSCCFTKGYNHYVEGTGSVLQVNGDIQMSEVFNLAGEMAEDEPRRLATLSMLQLRYFTPREVANLMGFPAEFEFPLHFNNRQCYRLLGNSLNVKVVCVLLNIITENDYWR